MGGGGPKAKGKGALRKKGEKTKAPKKKTKKTVASFLLGALIEPIPYTATLRQCQALWQGKPRPSH